MLATILRFPIGGGAKNEAASWNVFWTDRHSDGIHNEEVEQCECTIHGTNSVHLTHTEVSLGMLYIDNQNQTATDPAKGKWQIGVWLTKPKPMSPTNVININHHRFTAIIQVNLH